MSLGRQGLRAVADGGKCGAKREAKAAVTALASVRLAVAVLFVFVLLIPMRAAQASGNPRTVWLCKPGMAHDPCKANRTTTVVAYNGDTRTETVQKPPKASRLPIDCFYVYPTVSEQDGPNANLAIEPQESQVAIDQASRFSQDCRVFAPMYPQLTLKAIKNPAAITFQDEVKAYLGVLSAWSEYMQRFNKGRGVVLIGHSQGALMLIQLIREQIDPDAAVRSHLVAAVLLGGNVLVPEGQTVGGSFTNVPACQSAIEVACVIAYSSFLQEPPANSFFGRPTSPLLGGGTPAPGMQVLCVNPALLSQTGGAGRLVPFAPTTPFPGKAAPPAPSAATPWVSGPDEYTAQCRHENGASWLQVTLDPGLSEKVVKELAARNELAEELIGSEWGLHLYDVNIALGNLVSTIAIQGQVYAFEH